MDELTNAEKLALKWLAVEAQMISSCDCGACYTIRLLKAVEN